MGEFAGYIIVWYWFGIGLLQFTHYWAKALCSWLASSKGCFFGCFSQLQPSTQPYTPSSTPKSPKP